MLVDIHWRDLMVRELGCCCGESGLKPQVLIFAKKCKQFILLTLSAKAFEQGLDRYLLQVGS